jgi:hypothetical protein
LARRIASSAHHRAEVCLAEQPDALALGLNGWLAGPGLWVDPASVEIDRDLASDVCEQCLAEATLAVPIHNPASRRYKVLSVCPHCLRMGEA